MTTETRMAKSSIAPHGGCRGCQARKSYRTLEELGARVVVRMAKRERHRTRCQERGEQPLHGGLPAKAFRPGGEPERERGAQPSAEGAGEDVERPVHADHRAGKRS